MEGKNFKLDQKNKIKYFFNKTSHYWHNIYEGDTFINYHMKDRKNIVLNLIDEFANGSRLKVLDIGSGTGILTKNLVQKGHFVVGSDISENMIEKLKESMGNNHYKNFLGAVISDAEEICFSDNTFDAILCIGVLQYQLRNDRILKEVNRVLKKGDFCIFSIPNLLRINYFFDPFYCVKFIKRLIRKFILPKAKSNRNSFITTGLSGIIYTTPLTEKDDLSELSSLTYSKKYFFRELNDMIFQNGSKIKKIVAFGYGPFTFLKKNIFPDHISITISHKLNKLVEKYDNDLLKIFANRWVFVIQKE